jgi:hypothetical protein
MADAATMVAVLQQRHPLSQIATSGTHRLLLKQWLKEEDLLARRVALREARLDDARKENAFPYCAFFVFHATSILVLFLSSSISSGTDPSVLCRWSWIPCLVGDALKENVVGWCPPTIEPNVMQPHCEARSRILLITQRSLLVNT